MAGKPLPRSSDLRMFSRGVKVSESTSVVIEWYRGKAELFNGTKIVAIGPHLQTLWPKTGDATPSDLTIKSYGDWAGEQNS